MKTSKRNGKARAKAPTWTKVPGAHISNAEAAAVGETLTAFWAKHKRPMQAADLLEAAKAKTSPLHGLFEWNDAKAAAAHRLSRAGKLLGSIQITWEKVPGVKVSGKGAVALKGRGPGYIPARVVHRDVDMTKEYLALAKKELTSWYMRFTRIREVAEMVGVFEAIEIAMPEIAKDKAA